MDSCEGAKILLFCGLKRGGASWIFYKKRIATV